jgi:Fanconi anemia group D2 protein
MEKALEDSKLAIALVNLLKCFAKKNVHSELASKLSRFVQKLLKKDWEVKLKSDQVSALLDTHIMFAANSLDIVEFLSVNILPNSIKKDPSTEEEEIESEYCTLSKTTWIVYFKVLLTQLTHEFGTMVQTGIVKEEEHTFEDYFIKVDHCVKIFFSLIEITKIKHDNKQILAVALKQGKSFIELFMKVIPTLSHNFAEHKDAVNKMITTIQKSTRQIQSLCAHSKSNESKLASLVPSVRKVLESFLFKIKAMMQENNMGRRFWLGNLKPKSITGEAITEEIEEEEDSADIPVQDDIVEEEEEQEEKNEENDEIAEDEE